LMDTEIGFEYPRQVNDLLRGLEAAGVRTGELITAMAEVAAVNCIVAATGIPPLRVLVGSPSRRKAGGAVLQHLVCWRADDVARAVSENLRVDLTDRPDPDPLARVGRAIQDSLDDGGELAWERVLEARQEVTNRRDSGSAAEWIRCRRVLVL